MKKGERVTLECKRAQAEVPKSVWPTYSAFANAIGGLILLDVDEVELVLPVPTSAPINEKSNVTVNVAVNAIEELTERQRIIYNIINLNVVEDVVVTASSLSRQLNVHPRTIQRDLAVLASKSLVRHVGSDKHGHWEAVK